MCEPGYCESQSCQRRSCPPNQKLIRHGNCDCCGKCVVLKKEGSPCKNHEVLDLIQAPPGTMFMNSDCDMGLVCIRNKCEKPQN
ncbi:hypothetical protein CDAR_48141 [Caerostris darwini]|uniref:IGFBP N-terminal domain-containing protein n=1 Tax=Caerostris darwini TaxID=1538125 RepID=A0AAV4W4Z7_9ARAC|nr:hypothetical protein CDAR_48141 [Caerostris darwini]